MFVCTVASCTYLSDGWLVDIVEELYIYKNPWAFTDFEMPVFYHQFVSPAHCHSTVRGFHLRTSRPLVQQDTRRTINEDIISQVNMTVRTRMSGVTGSSEYEGTSATSNASSHCSSHEYLSISTTFFPLRFRSFPFLSPRSVKYHIFEIRHRSHTQDNSSPPTPSRSARSPAYPNSPSLSPACSDPSPTSRRLAAGARS